MKKILVIRFSSIGDIVLTSPVIRCLARQIPGAEIHYVTKEAFLPVLENNPYLSKIHVIKKEIDEIRDELKKENFDFVIDLHNNLRSARLKRFLKKPSASFPKLNFQKWLVVNLKIDRLPKIHIVDRYFEAAKKTGVKNDQLGLDYFISEKDAFVLPFPENDFVAIAIGAQHETKKLPVNKLEELIKKINRKILIIGGKDDESTGNKLEMLDPPRIKNFAGKLSLNQSAWLVSKARIVITHDTGMMHIAAAFRKRIVSVWGNTIPGFGMYPYLPGHENQYFIAEVKGLKCRPCSKIGYDKCPLGHFKCMNDQDTGLMVDRVEESF
jgi:ADP-heptose:LPS heptosyltransferase